MSSLLNMLLLVSGRWTLLILACLIWGAMIAVAATVLYWLVRGIIHLWRR
jgi:hypothetical protein